MLDSLLQDCTVGGIQIASNLSNTTKLILLDSLLQEFIVWAMYVFISLKLWVLEMLSEDSELIFTIKADFDLLLGQ